MPLPHQLNSWLEADNSELVAVIVADIQRHVSALQSSGESIYGYAALPGNYSTQRNPARLVVAFNRETDIAAENAGNPYYRFSVDEWRNYVHDGFDLTKSMLESQLRQFEEINTAAGNGHQSGEFKIVYTRKINRALLAALLQLRQHKIFDDDIYLIIWLSDSADGIMNDSAKALNKPEIYKQYASEFH